VIWEGIVEDGQGVASGKLTFPSGWEAGTLNLRGAPLHEIIRPGWESGWDIEYWMTTTVSATLYVGNHRIPVIAGVNTSDRTVEIVSRYHLRSRYGIVNDDKLLLEINDKYVL
jgi:hypothetical protein